MSKVKYADQGSGAIDDLVGIEGAVLLPQKDEVAVGIHIEIQFRFIMLHCNRSIIMTYPPAEAEYTYQHGQSDPGDKIE